MSQLKPVPLRRQQRDFTRQRLIDAARQLFLKNGTRATSVDDIAKAAGTSRATFYAHFTDKQDVIREFARTMWETAFAVYHQFGELKEWNHRTIGGWMRELFDAWDQNADTTYIVIQEMPSELRADFLAQMEQRVDALMSDNPLWSRFDEGEARRRASLLIFQLERSMDAAHYGGWKEDREALFKTLVDIWVATLAGSDRAAAAQSRSAEPAG
jgi:AcrR family transcriptional regulator